MIRYSLRSSFARQMLMLTGVVLALTIVGRIVALSGGTDACIGWPFCVPNSPVEWLQTFHRVLTGIAGLLLLFVFIRAWHEQRSHLIILPLTTVLTVLFYGQAFIGALAVTHQYPPHLAILHRLTAVSLWIVLIVLTFVSGSQADRVEEEIPLLPRRQLKDFLTLTKPWIVALLLATTIAGLVVGYRAWPPVSLIFWTLLGGALAAGGSSALNQYIDRELDKQMQRTARRPLASQRLTHAEGLAFGLALCIASYYVLAGMVNLLAAILALLGIFYYVICYSLWLKKATVQNIVIGGGAGAIPPMVGWAAATGHLTLTSWILFAIIFMWTPPHFWALAIVRKKDYERVGVPMLPVVRGEEETRRQILIYTLLLVLVSLLLPALHLAGLIYLISALVLGLSLLYAAWRSLARARQ